MSDSVHSTVTYTSISSDDGSLEVGSPGMVVYRYDGLPMHPPSPDYVPGPEHSPSPVYVPYSDPEEDPEKDDEDPEEDPADYLDDRDEEEEEESSGDDADYEEEDEDEDEEEEEEHLAPADSVPPPAYRITARMSIRDQTPIPFPSDRRADVPEVTLPPRKRLCVAPGPKYEVEECSSAPTARPTGGFRADYGFVGTLDAEIRRDPNREISYGITDVWVDPDEIAEEIPATDVAELCQRMTNFITTVRQDTDEIYKRLDDAQDDRSLMSGQLNLLHRDRRAHARTTRLIESEARASREAWVQSMDDSDTERFMTQMAALQSQQTPARDPAHPDIPEEAGSSS
ncbi:hypothetical protein Tco_1315396 [Tanacetum coccineum]